MKASSVNRLAPLAFVFLLLATTTVSADWAGISASIEEFKSDWIFENNDRNARVSRLNLNFEEKASSELRVGANIGRLSTSVSNNSGPRNTQKFDASYFGIYLRYPVPLGDYFALQNKLMYQYHSGSEFRVDDGEEGDDIDWREISFELGLSAKLANIRITPFAILSDVSGDIIGDSGTSSFESKEDVSRGVNVDIFLDPTSFIRLRLSSGDYDSASLVFAREF